MMRHSRFYSFIKRTSLFLVTLLIISSCGGNNPNPVIQNTAPTISGSISTIRVGEVLDFIPSANDVDGDDLAFSIAGKPSWTSFDSSSGLLSGTPSTEDLDSTASITISVSDGQASNSISFDLSVIKPIFFISIETNTLDAHRDMDVQLNACFISQVDLECAEEEVLLTIGANGNFEFQRGLKKSV